MSTDFLQISPALFIGLIAAIGTTNLVVVAIIRFAFNRNALSLAIRKRIILWTTTLIGAFTILFYAFPNARTSQDYVRAVTFLFFAPLACLHTAFWAIEAVNDSQWFNDTFRIGQGASARWAGEAALRKLEMASSWPNLISQSNSENRFFLGRSKRRFDTRPRNIGLSDDDHVISFGQTGSGKSLYLLYNVLSSWKGSVVIPEYKGELVVNTLEARSHINDTVRIVDPFGSQKLKGRFEHLKVGYNPLYEIEDINAPGASALVNGIADSVYIPGNASEIAYWRDLGRQLLSGAICHSLSALPEQHHNLPDIADFLTMGDKKTLAKLLADMSKNEAMGGLPIKAASVILRAGDRELGIHLNCLQQSLRWCSEPQMRTSLQHSDFSLKDLTKGKGASIFFVLPFEHVEVQRRWLRLVMRMGLLTVQRAPETPDPQVLFAVDEFPAMGRWESLLRDVRELRGAGIKLYILAQDVVSLSSPELYGQNWKTFISGATTQVIGINCTDTARWISDRLGHFMSKQDTGAKISRSLMEPAEVLAFLGKNTSNQIIIPSTGYPMQLNSVHFFKNRHSYRIR